MNKFVCLTNICKTKINDSYTNRFEVNFVTMSRSVPRNQNLLAKVKMKRFFSFCFLFPLIDKQWTMRQMIYLWCSSKLSEWCTKISQSAQATRTCTSLFREPACLGKPPTAALHLEHQSLTIVFLAVRKVLQFGCPAATAPTARATPVTEPVSHVDRHVARTSSSTAGSAFVTGRFTGCLFCWVSAPFDCWLACTH